MAEAVAGLAVGSVGLFGLVNQSITIIKSVEAGIHCSEAARNAALLLTLLGYRLDRWKGSYQTLHKDQELQEADKKALLWLERINKLLLDAQKIGKRYLTPPLNANDDPVTPHSLEISSMTQKLQNKLGGGTLSVGKRIRWALRDENKMHDLIRNLDMMISSLEKLPTCSLERRKQLAKEDAAAVVPSALQTEDAEGLNALKAAAQKVDHDFAIAASSSHTYRNIELSGEGTFMTDGDFYSEGWAKAGGSVGQGGSHVYEGIRAHDRAQMHNGNIFGGLSPFDVFIRRGQSSTD